MKYYVTTFLYKKQYKINIDDVFVDRMNDETIEKSNSPSTITRVYDEIPKEYLDKINVDKMISWLKRFNRDNKWLFDMDRKSLYYHFSIPKSSGGLRPIDAPCEDLQFALRSLGTFIEHISVMHHTAAFAYTEKRNTFKCVQKHQRNESNWYLKTDISGFFPNTTLDFVMNMAKMIFPMSEICKSEEGYKELKQALSFGFLNGGLPQGSPLSPSISTWMYIPIDHRLFNKLADIHIVYTRYADDMYISAKQHFPKDMVIKLIKDTFAEFKVPHQLKPEKIHYGSRCGQNWCLGLMMNSYNNITVGYRTKRTFKAALCSFILDTKNKKYWNIKDVYHLRGQLSYYNMIEKDYFNHVIKTAEKKWKVNVKNMFKEYFNGSLA